jgi:hypothetical protein
VKPLPEGWGIFPDPTLLRCPWSLFTPEVTVCVRWWREWRDWRVLPYPGDMLDQPAYVVEAIEVCEGAWSDSEIRALDRQRRELERLKNGSKG